jgi:PPK2 family polyphosphate:nucleotide phosphotransferase
MNLRDALRVPPGHDVDLAEIDPDGTPGLPKIKGKPKNWALEQLAEVGADLAVLQEKLYAMAKVGSARTRLLLVLQAMDCGGKDGTVKKVAGTMNPQGLQIVAFGRPTAEDLSHDFLWRIRNGLPTAGHIGIFNRSHYEDVLVVRVHDLVPKETWRARFAKINEFEQELVADGCTILKVMLHISNDEQAERLNERLHDPTKYWKHNPGDIDERAFWDDYQAAYADAVAKCSTDYAPWYVVPANNKWYRDWAVAKILRDTMVDMDLEYPPPSFDVNTERARLEASASNLGEQRVNKE